MTNTFNLPEHLYQRLVSELKTGESIKWAGQPIPDKYMKSGFKAWFFFIPWTAFTLFWIARASGFKIPQYEGGWSLFPLFGLPFLFVGIGGLSSPFWLQRGARSIIYAITNQRVLTITGIKSITIKSIPLDQIKNIERIQHPNGYGDLILEKKIYSDSDGDKRTENFGFFSINNVKIIHDQIENQIKGHCPSFVNT